MPTRTETSHRNDARNVGTAPDRAHGPNFPHPHWRAADFVDRLLRVAKPGDIPVEQPTKFDLVINLTTAKALGLDVPRSWLKGRQIKAVIPPNPTHLRV